jgi:hypothetical protein
MRDRVFCIISKLKQMSYYPTKDIIEMIGKKKTGYELKEEYKSIEEKIDEIRKVQKTYRHIDACAKIGNIQYLKYLHDNGCEWDNWVCRCAAQEGYIECLRYLHGKGCDWYTSCDGAAGCGQIECLKYLHENGCEWNKWTCASAALGGQIECLKYLHENGCKWDEITYEWAYGGGDEKCIKYVEENGCPKAILKYGALIA